MSEIQTTEHSSLTPLLLRCKTVIVGFMQATSLPRATPESQGISSTAISDFLEGVKERGLEFHSMMLLRHGHVVAEGWWTPYTHDKVHLLYSVSKSFTSTAVGFAMDEGLLSEDDFVTSLFPEDLPETVSEHLAAMQVRHLLSMATGHTQDTLDRMFEQGDDWTRGFLSLPPEKAPGSIFCYNNGATYMLSAIIQKVTGVKLLEYLHPRLLEPLGITHARWDENPQGINYGFSGFHTTTEAIAKLGQLYLQKGKWNGQQLLSEKWVETATRAHIPNAHPSGEDVPDWQQGYGYQFWRCQHNCYRADGAFGQFCVVMPEQDAVLAVTSATDNMQDVLDLTWTLLLPAMQDKPLNESLDEQRELLGYLSSLTLTPVKGETHSPVIQRVSGQTFNVKAESVVKTGELSKPNSGEAIQGITLHFYDHDCLLVLTDSKNEHQLKCSYNKWSLGETTFYGEPTSKIEVSGAWTNPNTFTMKIIYIETPHCLTASFHFDQESLTLKQRWNVSFGPLWLPDLVGHIKS
jgi:CubicO group peptidase (beta-lactamase class C family)